MVIARAVGDEVAALERWSAGPAEVHERVAHRFRRVEVRERARRYLAGLLARVERKNGWQLAEAMGEADPHGAQRLLNEATWDADDVRDDLRADVSEHRGDAASGVLIVDETGFPQQGTRSCGVASRYCGTAGTTANAQVGVFLAYASARGTAFIDRARYLPRAWTRDRARRVAAGVPKGTRFATKITLAKRLLARAFGVGVPARWVVADSFYGRSHALRRWLEQRERPYVLMIPKTTTVEYAGRRERAEQLGARLREDAWHGTAGGQQWVCLDLTGASASGMGRWLLVRRAADAGELAYQLAYGPAGTTSAELLRVCAVRWRIEEGFAQAQGELGLDHYAVRHWEAWHRFMTLCLLAHAYLAVLHLHARVPGAATAPPAHRAGGPASRARTRGRSRAVGVPPRWSRWRRRHQAAAARS